jgi:hypothetical protein
MRGTDPRSGFSRADVDLAERRGGEMLLAPLSTLTDEAKQTGALERGTPLSYGLSTAAFLGDLFNPSVDIPVAAGIRGAGVGARAAKEALDDPTNQARLSSMFGRLYHGVQGDDWARAINRPLSEREGNWFSGDLFSTPSLELADTYADTTIKKLRNLPKDLKVLDLMPGGRPLAQQSQELAEELASRYGVDAVDSMHRHKLYTGVRGDELRDVLGEYGFNALRHVSGQGAGRGSGLEKPVYVFFEPEGIKSSAVGPINRFVNDPPAPVAEAGRATLDALSYVPRKISQTVQDAREASLNAYQRALAEYPDIERANRQTFARNNPQWQINPDDSLLRMLPMPPNYSPVSQPAQPGAFDFLRYMFAQ